jgi:hypothetical protein
VFDFVNVVVCVDGSVWVLVLVGVVSTERVKVGEGVNVDDRVADRVEVSVHVRDLLKVYVPVNEVVCVSVCA